MFVATVAVSITLAALLALAAGRKLTHAEAVVRSYQRVGVPEERLNLLAAILLMAAAGIPGGLLWAPLGIAAAVGVIGYFVVAVGFHLRSGELGNLANPVGYLAIAVAVLVLRLTTL
ncbi:MAG: DoxX family protein [Sporichthyaceae bacterium]|nr:DoxX family protein [Sporichthyaceae bacterium]